MKRLEAREATRYLGKLACFAAPLALIFLFPLSILFASGELTHPDRIIATQVRRQTPTLVGLAYSNPEVYYKLHSALVRFPQIVAVGNSRVLELTADFFSPGAFYNTGRGVQKIKHFRAFLNHIPPGQEPRVLLIGLDQKMFNVEVDDLAPDDVEEKLTRVDGPADIFLAQWQTVWKDYVLQKKFSLRALLRRDNTSRIGLSAYVSDNGFQNDGSYLYGEALRQAGAEDAPSRFTAALNQVKNYGENFPAADHINDAAVTEFGSFLSEAKRRGIHVICFLPPFAPIVYQALQKDAAHFPYIFQLRPALQHIFKQHDFPLFDFANPAVIGSPDAEFMDGGHGLQKTYLRALIAMAEADKTLQSFTDLGRLKTALRESQSDFIVQFAN